MERAVVLFYVRSFIMSWSLHDSKGPSLCFDVVIIDPTRETVALSVISRPTTTTMELNTIVKIYKYRRLHEGHHFISMAMEVYGAPEQNIDRFIRECACLFHDRCPRGHLFLSFCIQCFKQRVNIVFQHVLASTIERNTALAIDACSQPPITIRSHNLHASDIKEAMGEIASYHERGTSSLSFSWFMWFVHLLAFLWPSLFVSSLMVPSINYIGFLCCLILTR